MADAQTEHLVKKNNNTDLLFLFSVIMCQFTRRYKAAYHVNYTAEINMVKYIFPGLRAFCIEFVE